MFRRNLVGILMIVWLAVGLIVRLNFETIPLTTPELSTSIPEKSTIPFAYPIDGTFGLENKEGLYWLSKPNVSFRIDNPLNSAVQIFILIEATASPCGFLPTIQTATIEGNHPENLKITGPSLNLTVDLLANSEVELRVRYKTERCVIKSDPRIFLGAIGKITTSWQIS